MSDELFIPDPLWRDAVAALDAGDLPRLRSLVDEHPALARDRLDAFEGYFARPYLLWFVAENPIRNRRLPPNIAEVTQVLLAAAERAGALAEQVGGALGLVASGCVPREQGVQLALIDVLAAAATRADLDSAMESALPHRELAAAERLLERGATLTLAAAASTGRLADLDRLGPSADRADRHKALMCAAVNAQPEAIRRLVALGVDLDAYGAPGYHAHTTALHQAVNFGGLETVRALVEAGARLDVRDRGFDGTPLGWARHFGYAEIIDYLAQATT